MKLLTSRLQEPARSAVRFLILGGIGTGIQYGIYYGLLFMVEHLLGGSQFLTNAAFAIGFIVEMVFNYVMSNYYTFGTKPNLVNLGGFLGARGINFVLQLLCLNVLLEWMSEEMAGIVAILIAGIVNYFILRLFFKKPKKEDSHPKGESL